MRYFSGRGQCRDVVLGGTDFFTKLVFSTLGHYYQLSVKDRKFSSYSTSREVGFPSLLAEKLGFLFPTLNCEH